MSEDQTQENEEQEVQAQPTTSQDQPQTIQIGNAIYNINDLNQRGLHLVDRLLTAQERTNNMRREYELAEILRNTLQQSLASHINEVGYEPVRVLEDDNESNDQ